MKIKDITTHFYSCTDLEVESATRKYGLVSCATPASDFPVKHLFIEFHHASIAQRFCEEMNSGTAAIFMRKEPDGSIFQTAGIKRLVIAHEGKLYAYGFDDNTPLTKWMESLGFAIGSRLVENF